MMERQLEVKEQSVNYHSDGGNVSGDMDVLLSAPVISSPSAVLINPHQKSNAERFNRKLSNISGSILKRRKLQNVFN